MPTSSSSDVSSSTNTRPAVNNIITTEGNTTHVDTSSMPLLIKRRNRGFFMSELAEIAVPVRIPENKSFEISLDECNTLRDIVEKLRHYQANSLRNEPETPNPLVTETYLQLMNIKDEIYKFTISQILQLLCAYKGFFEKLNQSLNQSGYGCHITFKQEDNGQITGFSRLILRYDVDTKWFYLRKSAHLTSTDSWENSKVSIGRNSIHSVIPVTIPEDDNIKFGPHESSLKGIINELKRVSWKRDIPAVIPQPINKTYSDLFEVTTKVYQFSISQMVQFVTVYRLCFRMKCNTSDNSAYLLCRMKDETGFVNCPGRLLLKFDPDIGVFNVRTSTHKHNHDMATVLDICNSAHDWSKYASGTLNEKKFKLYIHVMGKPPILIDIPESSSHQKLISNVPITGFLRQHMYKISPPISHRPFIHQAFAKLFFIKNAAFVFTPSQLLQLLNVYNLFFVVNSDRRLQCSNAFNCTVAYSLNYNSNENLFVVYIIKNSLHSGHSHEYDDVASMVGLKISEDNLCKLKSGNFDLSYFENENSPNLCNINSDNGHTDTGDSESIELINSDDGTKDDDINDEVYDDDNDLNMTPTSFDTDYASDHDEPTNYITPENPIISTTSTNSGSKPSVQRPSSPLSLLAVSKRKTGESDIPADRQQSFMLSHLSDDECARIIETTQNLMFARHKFKIGDSLQDSKEFEEEVHELMFFTQMLSDIHST
ncbi:unnamed protein product [Ambrosiozyma monospora]|uniref:Unnamed protein product n=1 Tax=Ambrosiozyma monospora TaxID=43982 RepID=A0A9W7DIY3_AMBMO|nr:unnamed protein product [Ambrosiozyma monospora]